MPTFTKPTEGTFGLQPIGVTSTQPEVYAIAPGIVEIVAQSRLQACIVHDLQKPLNYHYIKLDSLTVGMGDTVAAGQVIGFGHSTSAPNFTCGIWVLSAREKDRTKRFYRSFAAGTQAPDS